MSWSFPDVPFGVTDKDGTWGCCQFVSEDEETVTLDFTASNNQARMRVQIRKDDIRSITYPLPVPLEALWR